MRSQKLIPTCKYEWIRRQAFPTMDPTITNGLLSANPYKVKQVKKDAEKFRAIVEATRKRLGLAMLLLVLITGGLAVAGDYTDDQIVEAIYLAEGGAQAKYPYGIRSVRCDNASECKKICKNTVKNNRKRFAAYGAKRFPDFISFLASRYCPVRGRGLSAAERRLNGNWERNVRLLLKRGVINKLSTAYPQDGNNRVQV